VLRIARRTGHNSRIPAEHSLARKRPELARELERNGDLDLLALAAYSNRDV
jgi:hypothetical protein